MRHTPALLCLCLLATAAAEVRVRPDEWADQVIGSEELENWYRLDDDVYRCEQPDDDAMKELQRFGIKSILNLRQYHSDDDEAEGLGMKLYHLRWETDEVTIEQVVEALRIIKAAEKPILVHCWHGSDRTGTTCAAYRIVFQGWTPAAALDEMKNGGYGFHETFENLPALIGSSDWQDVKKQVMAD